jgi:hypothetical protein
LRNFNPDKLYVEFRDSATETEPVNKRKYTLTHSDLTADLFLTIGLEYAYDKVSDMRDEVLAEWRVDRGYSFIYVYVYINDINNPAASGMRNEIFRRELPLALQAIRYGDRKFFDTYPDLDHAPLWIYFDSNDPEYNRFENWGTAKDYAEPMRILFLPENLA